MRVYHGSDTNIEVIDLSKCQPGKDFGQGFYVTKYRRQAEIMANRVADWRHTVPIVTEFEFKESAYLALNLKMLRFDDYTEEWLDFIILNRNNDTPVQAHSFDIAEGPVADDEVAARIHDYLRGDVSKATFLEELKFKKTMHQICFCTTKSLQMLVRIDDKAESKIIHIDNNILNILVAEHDLSDTEAADLYYSSITYSLLADEASGLYLMPWMEIYQLLLQELQAKN
ncbi:MAG: DUF3990 domain-containing protein [Tannerellaceae bacterium]|jgi:hypothetical protein|nr:DUF3990 domain-containing protein [Tannerellaceae bacterium]